MLRSKTALRMERTEKMTEAMGTEGRQATLPRLSVTHLEERGSLQGMVRIPRTIRKSSRTSRKEVSQIISGEDLLFVPSCIGASTEPQMDLISCALCSSFLYSLLSLEVCLGDSISRR